MRSNPGIWECSIPVMAACALHRVFFLSTMVIWMFATMYVLRSGTGTSSMEEFMETQDSFKVMEELEKQNLQLREIAQKMRLMEMKRSEKAASEKQQDHKLLDLVRMQLDECQIRNKELVSKVAGVMKQKDAPAPVKLNTATDSENSLESHMRSSYNHVIELWYFMQTRLNAIKDNKFVPKDITDEIEYIIEDVKTRKSAALIEVELMQGLRRDLQKREMKTLQNLVQNQIQYLQNPEDCDRAKKLVCNLNKGCGFGCQLHHVAYCFLVAIGTQRTLILDSSNWRYSNDGWESIFLPLSKTCTSFSGVPVMWNGEEDTRDSMVLTLPIVDSMQRRPPYLPLNIPENFAAKLTRFHGNPPVWWLGQLISYLIRPQAWLARTISEFEQVIGFEHPIAGIHIRRTDKVGSEAAFHSVSEYMNHIVDWYDKEDLKNERFQKPAITTRLVYVASDDPHALQEARRRYPDYKFLGDMEISKNAGTSRRYSRDGLIGVLTDIILLSKCDYLVGTFSSQVSRVAYELMQTLHPDAAAQAHSLDDVFYFGGQGPHSQKVIYSHQPRPGSSEIDMDVGDEVGVAGNHWDGFSKGVNRRTHKIGLYPSYKVVEVITKVNFPAFSDDTSLKSNKSSGLV